MGKNYLVLIPNRRDTNGPSDSTSEGRRFAGRDLTPPKTTTTLKSPNTLTAVSLTPPSLRPSPLAALSSTSPAAAAAAAVTPSAAAAPSLATAGAASSTARQPGQLNLNVGPGRSASLVYGGIGPASAAPASASATASGTSAASAELGSPSLEATTSPPDAPHLSRSFPPLAPNAIARYDF